MTSYLCDSTGTFSCSSSISVLSLSWHTADIPWIISEFMLFQLWPPTCRPHHPCLDIHWTAWASERHFMLHSEFWHAIKKVYPRDCAGSPGTKYLLHIGSVWLHFDTLCILYSSVLVSFGSHFSSLICMFPWKLSQPLSTGPALICIIAQGPVRFLVSFISDS